MKTVLPANFTCPVEEGAATPLRFTIPSRTFDAVCPLDGHGPYTGTVYKLAGVDRPTPCPVCDQDVHNRMVEQQQEQIKKKSAEAISQRLFKRTCMPPRFISASIDLYDPVCVEAQRAMKICRKYVEHSDIVLSEGTSLVFFGTTGSGKTYLACAIGNALFAKGRSVLYCTVKELIESVRERFDAKGITYNGQINQFLEPDFLIIDEIGVQNTTNDEYITLNSVLDGRYLKNKSTLLLTNEDIQTLKKYVGAPLIDRLSQAGGRSVPFTWDSYRRKVKPSSNYDIAHLLDPDV